MTLHSQKKKDKYYWLIAIVITVFAYACGPSQAEKIQASSHTALKNIYYPTNEIYLNSYEANGHLYIGFMTGHSTNDVLTHSGECKLCHQNDSLLIESILKKLLQTKKP